MMDATGGSSVGSPEGGRRRGASSMSAVFWPPLELEIRRPLVAQLDWGRRHSSGSSARRAPSQRSLRGLDTNLAPTLTLPSDRSVQFRHRVVAVVVVVAAAAAAVEWISG